MKFTRNERGFTLIELMVVVIIIGILAAIAMPVMSKQTDKAKVKRAVAELKSMKTIIDTYYAEHGSVPVADVANDASNKVGHVLQQAGVKFTGSNTDPNKGILDPWGKSYQYSVTGTTAYKLICAGPNQAINTGADDIYVDLEYNPTEGSNVTPLANQVYSNADTNNPTVTQ